MDRAHDTAALILLGGLILVLTYMVVRLNEIDRSIQPLLNSPLVRGISAIG